jgi:hypothetical protein
VVDGRTARPAGKEKIMAKGQMRSNKEAKKPKKDKAKAPATAGVGAAAASPAKKK